MRVSTLGSAGCQPAVATSDVISIRARKRVKELAILCAMNENKFQISPRFSAKPLSLEQELIDKARGGWEAVDIAIELSKRQEF
jgi:hypothetical protein